MDTREKILAFIRQHGPTLPTKIAKEIEAVSYIASAHLAELKEQGKIKISNIKVGGGSPLYFLPGQEAHLEGFISNLNEKQKKVYGLLKQKKIIRDSSLVPVFKAAIRTVKDFAVPYTVSIKGVKEIFWKFYDLTKEETEKLTRALVGVRKKPIKKKEEQKKLKQKKTATKTPGEFYQEVINYFQDNSIKVIEESIIRKKSDLEFIVELQSSVGSLKYFVKAKSKKRINDGDLSSVFIQGQTKRLPVLFLSKGTMTKKAAEMLETEFKGMRFNKIGS
ncbi:hypothetical protein GOV09_06120 [Candidatus Woesearchaeota archaeon]|nr:hypothetical protein [Candidatus Woesearchaeota archaeon]